MYELVHGRSWASHLLLKWLEARETAQYGPFLRCGGRHKFVYIFLASSLNRDEDPLAENFQLARAQPWSFPCPPPSLSPPLRRHLVVDRPLPCPSSALPIPPLPPPEPTLLLLIQRSPSFPRSCSSPPDSPGSCMWFTLVNRNHEMLKLRVFAHVCVCENNG